MITWSPMAAASDLDKERRWSEQIIDTLLVGDAVDLSAGENTFLAIYAEASDGSADRAVILLHGIGAHPDWPEVISPLRSNLPDHGWATLSIQMPILGNEATTEEYAPLFDEVAPRVDAAARFLLDKGSETVVLLGHSLGASMAATYLANGERPGIDGLVAISMGVASEQEEQMNGVKALEKITVPVLDIYGSRDLDSVLGALQKRSKASHVAKNADYRQLQIEGADHFFLGLEDALTRRVYGWLKTTFDQSPR